MENVVIIGLIGASGIIVGSIITILGSRQIAKKNHEYSLEKLKEEHKMKVDYMKREIFFKKKTEFFERITKEIEKQLHAYSDLKVLTIIKQNKPGEKIKNIFKDLRNLKEIYPPGISLYFKNVKLTLGLTEFITKGANIKLMLPELNNQLKRKEINKEFSENFNDKLDEILPFGEKLIFILKAELEE